MLSFSLLSQPPAVVLALCGIDSWIAANASRALEPKQASGRAGQGMIAPKCVCVHQLLSRTRFGDTPFPPASSIIGLFPRGLQRVCPFGRSVDYLQSNQQGLVGPIGHLPATRVGSDEGANNLRVAVPNGVQVNFDVNFDFEIDSYTPGVGGLGAGTYKYKRDNEAWTPPKPFDLTSGADVGLLGVEQARQLTVRVNNYPRQSGIFVYFVTDDIDGTTVTLRAGDRWFVNVTHNEGSDFTAADTSSAHQLIECSGRGT